MTHTTRDGDIYLLNYRLLVKDLPELAGWWPDMGDEERLQHRLSFSQTWGIRYQLGDLYRAGQLMAKQETELAALDDELIQHLDEANLCYGLDLQSVAQLFTWGTPLAQSDKIIRISIHPRILNEIAPALAALGESVQRCRGAGEQRRVHLLTPAPRLLRSMSQG